MFHVRQTELILESLQSRYPVHIASSGTSTRNQLCKPGNDTNNSPIFLTYVSFSHKTYLRFQSLL